MWLIIVSIRDDTNPFVKRIKNNVISLYEKWEKKKKKKTKDPYVKGLPRKVVLDTSRGMNIKPWMEENMADTQFVVKQSHMNTPICTTFFIPMACGSA